MTRPTSDPAITALSLLGSAALTASWRRSWVGAVAGTVISMAITLLAWGRYARIWEAIEAGR
ncbi:hypothetical protein [Mycobacteroides franklinii]|nr:hypothetical protein [Mycobacteroides franklinii]